MRIDRNRNAAIQRGTRARTRDLRLLRTGARSLLQGCCACSVEGHARPYVAICREYAAEPKEGVPRATSETARAATVGIRLTVRLARCVTALTLLCVTRGLVGNTSGRHWHWLYWQHLRYPLAGSAVAEQRERCSPLPTCSQPRFDHPSIASIPSKLSAPDRSRHIGVLWNHRLE